MQHHHHHSFGTCQPQIDVENSMLYVCQRCPLRLSMLSQLVIVQQYVRPGSVASYCLRKGDKSFLWVFMIFSQIKINL